MWTMTVEPSYVMVPPGSARRPKITGCITKGEPLEQNESVLKGIQTSSFCCVE
jgi:hypothetical protein